MQQIPPSSLTSLATASAKTLLISFAYLYQYQTLQSPPMAPQITSIQSFFQPEVPSAQRTQKPAAHHQPSNTSDGFTSSEIEAALHPSLHKWQPRTTYNDTDIRDLVAGPGCVALMGRVVNFHNVATPSKMPRAAKGCLKLTVKDNTGAFTVSTPPTILLALSYPLTYAHR